MEVAPQAAEEQPARKIEYTTRDRVRFNAESASPDALRVLKQGSPRELLILRVRSSSSYFIEKALPLTIANIKTIELGD